VRQKPSAIEKLGEAGKDRRIHAIESRAVALVRAALNPFIGGLALVQLNQALANHLVIDQD